MTEETATTARRGPKPNPLVRYRKANEKADKARAAFVKVQSLSQQVEALGAAKAEAEAEEQAAYRELQESLAEIAPPPSLGDVEER